ncbi:MAG TPA: hypothetical protein VFK14_13915 [Solirubrobacterales bacterium]|nr:hypothetical protein [Solirubrobacterales bacterium]
MLAALAASSAAAPAAPPPAIPLAVDPGVPANGRAWELVSPEEPVSASLQRLAHGYVAASGNRILYSTLGKLPDAPMQEYVAVKALAIRESSGWVSATLFRPSVQHDSPTVDAVNRDLSEWIINGSTASGGPHLLRIAIDGSWTQVAGSETPGTMPFIGASEDLQRVYFSSSLHLVSADAGRTSGSSIYESSGDGGIQLVDVGSAGQPISSCGSEPVAASVSPRQGVSLDGRRIYFTSHPGCAGTARVYLGEPGAPAVEVSASRCDLADCGPEADVEFAAATPDDSSAYLLTTQRLTDDDTDSHVSLYRYDAETGELTLLTPSADEISTIAGVQVSEDGTKVYFSGASPESFTKHLFEVDGSGLHQLPIMFPWFSGQLQLSADGNVAVVATQSSLLPEDTDSAVDVYRYDDRSETLTLLSSGGSGGKAATFVDEAENQTLADPVGGGYRVMSADGSRIFFTTAEALLPQDHNELDDVYEWTEGGLGLVSSGAADAVGSFLDGVTPDVSSVFFTTGDTLLPRDRDGGARDIYAARIGGGFPEPPPPASCEGEACRSAVPPPGPRVAPRSAAAGNRLRLGRISAADRRRMAATGRIDLLVEAPRPGHLSAVARARVGRRVRTVAKTAAKVAAPGPLHLRMRLSRPARAHLAGGRKLRLRLRLRLGKTVPPKGLRIVLGGRR